MNTNQILYLPEALGPHLPPCLSGEAQAKLPQVENYAPYSVSPHSHHLQSHPFENWHAIRVHVSPRHLKSFATCPSIPSPPTPNLLFMLNQRVPLSLPCCPPAWAVSLASLLGPPPDFLRLREAPTGA